MMAACASTAEQDDLAGETSDAVDGKADGAVDGASTYFEVVSSHDHGFALSRLNRSTTVCHDGSPKTSCWTPVLDWSATDLLAPTQQKLLDATTLLDGTFAIVRGRFAKTNTTAQPTLGRFIITEAWVAEGASPPDGVFARIIDNGVRCITAPCPSMTEKGLNGSNTAAIAALDYSLANLSPREIDAFEAGIADPSGIIVAGNRYTVHGTGGTAKGRAVTNAFHQLVETGGCFIGGCSRQVCSDISNVITTCNWNPEYACYVDATCGRQADGSCGWTPTDELNACLAAN